MSGRSLTLRSQPTPRHPLFDALSVTTARLRLALSSQSAGEWTNWADDAGSNPGVIAAAHRPTVAASSGGTPLADFQTNDSVQWPLATSNNNRNTLAYFMWVAPDATSGQQDLIVIWNGSGGASDRQLLSFFSGTSWVVILQTDATHGRQATVTGAAVAGTGKVYGIEFDTGASGDACLTMSINGAVQTPTFAASPNGDGPLGALTSVTGNITLGNFNFNNTASSPLGGKMGPEFWAMTRKLSGTAAGQLLTAAARAAVVAHMTPA